MIKAIRRESSRNARDLRSRYVLYFCDGEMKIWSLPEERPIGELIRRFEARQDAAKDREKGGDDGAHP
ncbi:MAG: hypothetical protein ACOX0A_07270 [Thermoguttaceae bacterium]|jgi:hypothetical protein